MVKLHIHPVGLGLIIFGFLTWLVALGGIAATTNFCMSGQSPPGESTYSYCSRTYQLEWWSIWFEFFLLLCMIATCFLNAFERARFIYLTYLALVTALLTITSRNFITATVLAFYSNGGTITFQPTKESANNAAAAGAVMLCITNYALIVFIGLGASAAQQAQVNTNAAPEQKYAPSSF